MRLANGLVIGGPIKLFVTRLRDDLKQYRLRQHAERKAEDIYWRDRAKRRITQLDPILAKYSATILYNAPQGFHHWVWVATTPIDEIIEWAELTEQQET